MKILVIGRGGREHAIVWKLSQSPSVEKIYCATGNAGIEEHAELVNIKAEHIEELRAFALSHKIDITIAGPEISYTEGIVDEFSKYGLKVLGPTKDDAIIEASKAFAKNFMARYKIPTAKFGAFSDIKEAHKYIDEIGAPFAIKADGFTGGKGFIIAKDNATAKVAVHVMMEDETFGSAGKSIIIEELLKGIEISVLAFTDGNVIVPMVSAQQFKKAYDGNLGPATGGMGALSPAPTLKEEVKHKIIYEILVPVAKGLQEEGRKYKGILYTDIIITKEGPKVVEFHVRFGDPETQVILPRLKSDLGEIFMAMAEERLKEVNIEWKDEKSAAIILTSGGYPMKYEIGKKIFFKKKSKSSKVIIFHAGTRKHGNNLVTAGGRVLNVVALDKTLSKAVKKAYSVVENIEFEGMHYRKDIGVDASTKEVELLN